MSGLLDAYRFGTPTPTPGPAAYATNESLAEQDTTGASLDGAALSETLENGVDYLFFWSQDVQTSATSSVAGSDLLVNATTIFATQPSIVPKEVGSPIDYQTMGGLFKHTGSGAAETFALKATRGNAATLRLRNSRLSRLKMGADDEYAESLARQTFTDTTANKTAQTAATLNFTPPSAGDYTVIASFHVDMTNSTNVAYGMELTDGTTTTGEVICRPPATNDRCPMMLILPLTGISGSKTITLKVRQTGTGATPIAVSDIRIVAIRNDRFVSVRSIKAGSTSSGSDGSYVDTGASQTFTPAAADHLTIAGWQMGSSSTSVSALSQYLDGADSVNEFIREYGIGVSNSGLGAVSHRLAAYAASSRKQVIQRRSEAAANNAVQASAAIVTFELTGVS